MNVEVWERTPQWFRCEIKAQEGFPFPLVGLLVTVGFDNDGLCCEVMGDFVAGGLFGNRISTQIHNPNRPFTVDEVRLE